MLASSPNWSMQTFTILFASTVALAVCSETGHMDATMLFGNNCARIHDIKSYPQPMSISKGTSLGKGAETLLAAMQQPALQLKGAVVKLRRYTASWRRLRLRQNRRLTAVVTQNAVTT